MRLLVVSQYFWPEAFPINSVVQDLKKRGHQVVVLTGVPNYPAGRLFDGYRFFSRLSEDFEGVPVIRAPQVTRGRSKNWRLALNYLSFALSASFVGLLRCRGRFDAVLVYEPSPVTVGIPAIMMATAHNAPLLFWIQDLWPETLEAVGVAPGSAFARAGALVADIIHRACDVLLAQSRAYVKKLVERGIPRERIEYLPNSAEDVVSRAAPAAAAMTAIEGFRIVFAGNIGSAQSFETIIEAATRTRREPAIHWIVFGEGIMREWVEREVAARGLGNTFHMLGWQPAETMPAYFASADALLVTLRADSIFALTVPSKIQTYLASGRPILAALNGEGAAIVREAKAGLVGPAEDAQALADNALALYRSDEAAKRAMGASGRSYFEEHFSRARLIDRLEQLIHSAVEKRAHPDTRR